MPGMYYSILIKYFPFVEWSWLIIVPKNVLYIYAI